VKNYPDIKGVIFDFDGTLYKKVGIAFNLVKEYLPDTFNILRERAIRRRFKGCDYPNPEEYLNAFFNDLGKKCSWTPEKTREWYFTRYMPRYAIMLKKHYRSRKGAKEILQFLDSPDSPLKAAIYSDYPLLKDRMEAIGLSCPQRIRLYSSHTFGAQKPAARPLLQIAEDLNLKPHEILVIGDNRKADGQGAKNAGMRYFHIIGSKVWGKAAAMLLS